jgi:hypothetical protein
MTTHNAQVDLGLGDRAVSWLRRRRRLARPCESRSRADDRGGDSAPSGNGPSPALHRTGITLRIAFAGAVLSAGAEAWHAYSHLRLDTHNAPLAGTLSVLGFIVIVIGMSVSSWERRRRAARTTEQRRAA